MIIKLKQSLPYLINLWAVLKKLPTFNLKIVYFYVIEVADSKSDFGFYYHGLVSEIYEFLQNGVQFTKGN